MSRPLSTSLAILYCILALLSSHLNAESTAESTQKLSNDELSQLGMHILKSTSIAPLEFVSLKSVDEDEENFGIHLEIRNKWVPEEQQLIETAVNVKKAQIGALRQEMEQQGSSSNSRMGGENHLDLNSDLAKKITSFAVQSLRAQSAFSGDVASTMQVKKITSTIVNGVVYRVYLDIRTRPVLGDGLRTESVNAMEIILKQNSDGTFEMNDVQYSAQSTGVAPATESPSPSIRPGAFFEINKYDPQVILLSGYAFAHHEMASQTSQPKKLIFVELERAYKQIIVGYLYKLVLRVQDPSANSVTQLYLVSVTIWQNHDGTFAIYQQDEQHWIPPTYATFRCAACESWKQLSQIEYGRCTSDCFTE